MMNDECEMSDEDWQLCVRYAQEMAEVIRNASPLLGIEAIMILLNQKVRELSAATPDDDKDS